MEVAKVPIERQGFLEYTEVLNDYFDNICIQALQAHSKVQCSAYNLPAF